MEEPDEPRPNRRATWALVVVFLFLFVFYPLSIGPAVVVAIRCGDRGVQVVEFVYWPFVSYERRTGDRRIEFYCDWWVRHTGGDPRVQ